MKQRQNAQSVDRRPVSVENEVFRQTIHLEEEEVRRGRRNGGKTCLSQILGSINYFQPKSLKWKGGAEGTFNMGLLFNTL